MSRRGRLGRVQLNLVVFALLGVVLTVWAVRNVLELDPFSRPYRITAQFERSPGLQAGFDVTYLGVAVGEIGAVRLEKGKVVVDLVIDKGEHVPRGATAAAGLKSAIGEPYVDLAPARGRLDAPPMRPGEVIPLSRTSVSRTYGDLFDAVTDAVNGLDPKNLRVLTRELADGLEGRGDTLRVTVDGASRLAGTFAEDTRVLDELIGNLSTLTGTLAGVRGELGTGVAATAGVTSSLADLEKDLARIRDGSPDLVAKFARLLRDSEAAAKCTLGSLGGALPVLLSDGNVAALDEGLAWSPELAKAMRGAVTFVNGEPNLNINFVITPGPVEGAVEYRNLAPLPDIRRIPECTGIELPERQKPPKPGATATATPRAGGDPATVAQDSAPVRNSAEHGRDDGTPWLVYLPPVVAGLILLRVVMSMLGATWRPTWRRRNR
ncbi:MlaD family protein [Actinomadura algeriensis]|uniref:Phospholipid/cholesterol/gamma-HCH transport system substrate-binding protein n=1 Tax=Actinomadura algeriensis TaxID=1679523 RepID=A0ABR9K1G9_9ACTN|nr:MlaD family protein [Actinomadura algeriensis]MBE1536681.1 phospholipid/cholesterol/gamma-HCH transport system substrate-binding protein [Actinomadura algeriensis]